MSNLLVTRKTLDKLGAQMNDSVGSKVSSFAMKQMQKMGWTEGQGLGKDNAGIKSHLKIKKREDAAGLGTDVAEKERLQVAQEEENWWAGAFDKGAIKVSKKHKKKKKDKPSKSEKKKAKVPTMQELFEATGGVRLGMRARTSQKGKIARTEGDS